MATSKKAPKLEAAEDGQDVLSRLAALEARVELQAEIIRRQMRTAPVEGWDKASESLSLPAAE